MRRGKREREREKKDLENEHTVQRCVGAEVTVMTDVMCPSSSAARSLL